MATNLSRNLKTLLAREKKTATWLAKESGVPRTTISSWLKGQQAAVNVEQITKVALTLKIPLWRLLNELDQPDPNEAHLSQDVVIRDLFEGDIRVKISKIEPKKRSE